MALTFKSGDGVLPQYHRYVEGRALNVVTSNVRFSAHLAVAISPHSRTLPHLGLDDNIRSLSLKQPRPRAWLKESKLDRKPITPNEPRYTSVRRTGASKPKACSSQLLHRDVASRCHDAGALKRKLGAEAAAAAGAGEASAGRPAGGWAVVGLLH